MLAVTRCEPVTLGRLDEANPPPQSLAPGANHQLLEAFPLHAILQLPVSPKCSTLHRQVPLDPPPNNLKHEGVKVGGKDYR